MNTYYLLGVFCGLFIGFVLIFSLLRYTRKDRGKELIYDERQQALRGKSYKYGFFAVIISNVIYGFAESSTDHLLSDPIAAMTICLCIGIYVFAATGIWNEAYFAMNEKPKRIVVIFLVISIINIASGIRNILHGNMIKNGTLQICSTNMTCGILMLALLLVMLMKHFAIQGEED